MGYFGVGETVAVSVGPLIGMSVLTQYDFHGLFFGGMFILLLALLMAVFVSRKPHTGTVEDQPEVPFKLIEKEYSFLHCSSC